jgi:hypothetical protein
MLMLIKILQAFGRQMIDKTKELVEGKYTIQNGLCLYLVL